ncbi:MAG: amylo-alpha-1,6-glucosidase, partial [Armatimonadota bacterium]
IAVRVHYSGINANECCKAPDFDDLEQRVDVRDEEERFIITNSPHPYSNGIPGNIKRCRILGSTVAPVSHLFVRPSRSDLHYKVDVKPGEIVEFPIIYAVSNEGEDAVRAGYEIAQDHKAIFAKTVENISIIKETCDLMTPDPMINRGVFWSKINTIRVQHKFPLGYGFTNMPPYDIMVVRDASWCTCGGNYITPEFSRRLIETITKHCIYDTGQLTEFIHLAKESVTRRVYGISLNDCTPMFMVALYKHFCLTHDEEFLREHYPIIERAAEYILAQVKDGLVFATTPGTSMYGVVGWRNVLACDSINGYVPELNAECVFALTLASELAKHLGYSKQAERFLTAAQSIRKQMNAFLVSARTELYYLMIDQWGEKREDITADLAVPAMYDIPAPELKARILDILTSPQFWTPYGCRTVGSEQPEYDPRYRQSGAEMSLMGGIWPNLAGWVAYAGRKTDPARMAEALQNIYRISEVPSPVDMGHVCPGEFPECLDGDTFASLGMKASPWTPPSYLWLAIEGLVGVEPKIEGLAVDPHIPQDWKWMAVKDMSYEGGIVSFFLWDGTIYSNASISSSRAVELYTDEVHCVADLGIYAIALRRGDDVILFAASSRDVKGKVTITTDVDESCRVVEVVLDAGQAVAKRIFPTI